MRKLVIQRAGGIRHRADQVRDGKSLVPAHCEEIWYAFESSDAE